MLAKGLYTSLGGMELGGARQLQRQGGTGKVVNSLVGWVRSLYG